MAKKLYSVNLTCDAKKLIYCSLKEYLEENYQRCNVRFIVDVLIEFSKVVDNNQRIYLSSSSWLLVLASLRSSWLEIGIGRTYRFRLWSIATSICKSIYSYEGELAFTYRAFRFFFFNVAI